jgi:hypothetical protein
MFFVSNEFAYPPDKMGDLHTITEMWSKYGHLKFSQTEISFQSGKVKNESFHFVFVSNEI